MLSFFAGSLILTGCVVYRTAPPALSVSEIIQMSRDGAWSKDIIAEIDRTHSVYMIKAGDLAKLSKEGVQDSVLNCMDQTRIDAIRQRDSYGYMGPYGNGYWYNTVGWGMPLLSWVFGFYPSFVFRSGPVTHFAGHAIRSFRR